MWQAINWWFNESRANSGPGSCSRQLQVIVDIPVGAHTWGPHRCRSLYSSEAPGRRSWSTAPGQELPSLEVARRTHLMRGLPNLSLPSFSLDFSFCEVTARKSRRIKRCGGDATMWPKVYSLQLSCIKYATFHFVILVCCHFTGPFSFLDGSLRDVK